MRINSIGEDLIASLASGIIVFILKQIWLYIKAVKTHTPLRHDEKTEMRKLFYLHIVLLTCSLTSFFVLNLVSNGSLRFFLKFVAGFLIAISITTMCALFEFALSSSRQAQSDNIINEPTEDPANKD